MQKPACSTQCSPCATSWVHGSRNFIQPPRHYSGHRWSIGLAADSRCVCLDWRPVAWPSHAKPRWRKRWRAACAICETTPPTHPVHTPTPNQNPIARLGLHMPRRNKFPKPRPWERQPHAFKTQCWRTLQQQHRASHCPRQRPVQRRSVTPKRRTHRKRCRLALGKATAVATPPQATTRTHVQVASTGA